MNPDPTSASVPPAVAAAHPGAARDPGNADALWRRVAVSLSRQGMMRHLGVRLVAVASGSVSLAMPYSERVSQQQGGYHGGAMGALADIAGGYAALTVAPEGMEVTTVEYKINFLAAFGDGELLATGRVLRAGRRVIVTAADVVHVAPDGHRSPCAVMQQTIVPVPMST